MDTLCTDSIGQTKELGLTDLDGLFKGLLMDWSR